jgi:hypothetical protein
MPCHEHDDEDRADQRSPQQEAHEARHSAALRIAPAWATISATRAA